MVGRNEPILPVAFVTVEPHNVIFDQRQPEAFVNVFELPARYAVDDHNLRVVGDTNCRRGCFVVFNN